MKINRTDKIILIISLILITIGSFLIIYKTMNPSCPPSRCPDIEMEYVGINADGNLVVEIKEIRREVYSISEVKMYMYNRTGIELIDFPENGITFEKAKQNYLDPLYDGNISYHDKDNDNKVTRGDEIIIKGVENGGVGESGGVLIQLYKWDGEKERGVITYVSF